MKYLVTARLKEGMGSLLKKSIDNSSLGRGSMAGGEYIRNMKSARLLSDGSIEWVEVCFCTVPLAEERPYWEVYFSLEEIKDAVDRSVCKSTNGEDFWACKNCNCSKDLEEEIAGLGLAFYQLLD